MIMKNQQEFIQSILGERPSKQQRKNLRDSLYIQKYRDASVVLLREFDAFCNEHNVEYFLFTDTLQGAYAYQDYVPGEKTVHLGMLKEEYDKLRIFIPEGERISGELSWIVTEKGDSKHVVNRLNPLVKGSMCVPVLYDGCEVFNDASMPMMVQDPSFHISVFYSLPDDFYTMRYLYDRVDKLNKRAKKLDRVTDGKPTRNPFLYVQSRDRFVAKAYKLASRYEKYNTEYCARILGDRSKRITKEQARSRQRLLFHGIEVWGPGEGNPWGARPVVGDVPEELKRLQGCALEIASEIHRICKELDIGYFACGGTMLGYVRHGGFIPWDDDIDVGMLRADYERFLKEAPELLDNNRFFLQTRTTDPKIPYLFSKVRMNNTLYITEYNQYRDFHKGICVDIFPFDEVPNLASEQEAFKKKIIKLSKRHNSIANNQYGSQQVAISDGRKTLDHIIAHVRGGRKWHKYCNMSLAKSQEAYDLAVTELSHSAGKESYSYVASFVPSYTMIRKEDLLPYHEVDFAGIKLNMPAKPETFLAMQYGDFMALPPMHKRIGHALLEMGVR